MVEEIETRAVGRPYAGGETPKRNVRIGHAWDEAERLALELARLDGKVRQVRNRATGEVEDKGDVTGYVEAAIREHNARMERLIAKRRAAAAG
jgi:hypothetical protein